MSKFQQILDSEYCCESNEISELLLETYNINIELVSEGLVDKAKSIVNKIWEAFLKFLKKVKDFFMKMYQKVKKFITREKVIVVENVVPVDKWESVARDLVDGSVHAIEDFIKTSYATKIIEKERPQSEEILKVLRSGNWLTRPLIDPSAWEKEYVIPVPIFNNREEKVEMVVNDEFYKHVDGLVKELTRYQRKFDVIRESAPIIKKWCESVFIDLPKDHPDYEEQLGYFTSSVQEILIRNYVGSCVKGMTELTNDAKKVLKAISEA